MAMSELAALPRRLQLWVLSLCSSAHRFMEFWTVGQIQASCSCGPCRCREKLQPMNWVNLQLARQTKMNTDILHRKSCDLKSVCSLEIRASGINTDKLRLPLLILVYAAPIHFSLCDLKIQAGDFPQPSALATSVARCILPCPWWHRFLHSHCLYQLPPVIFNHPFFSAFPNLPSIVCPSCHTDIICLTVLLD